MSVLRVGPFIKKVNGAFSEFAAEPSSPTYSPTIQFLPVVCAKHRGDSNWPWKYRRLSNGAGGISLSWPEVAAGTNQIAVSTTGDTTINEVGGSSESNALSSIRFSYQASVAFSLSFTYLLQSTSGTNITIAISDPSVSGGLFVQSVAQTSLSGSRTVTYPASVFPAEISIEGSAVSIGASGSTQQTSADILTLF